MFMAARRYSSAVIAPILLVGGCRAGGIGSAARADGGPSHGSLAADAPAIPPTDVGGVLATADRAHASHIGCAVPPRLRGWSETDPQAILLGPVPPPAGGGLWLDLGRISAT